MSEDTDNPASLQYTVNRDALITRQPDEIRCKGLFESRHAEELAALIAKAKAGGARSLTNDEANRYDVLYGRQTVAEFLESERGSKPRHVAEMAFAQAVGMICADRGIQRERNRHLEDRIIALEAAAKPRHRVPARSRALT